MFKLINFIDDETFNQLRYQMRADLSNNFSPKIQLPLLDEDIFFRLGQEGIEIDINEITIEQDRTLSYRGIRVLIYIRDISYYGPLYFSMPRFHVAHCNKLEEMKINGRKNRYVIANREDGLFLINIMKRKIETKLEKLMVCQLCLEALRWDGFSMKDNQKKKIVNNFSIANFFEKYPKSLDSLNP